DGTSPFEHEPPFRRRRNSLKLWTYAGIVFALVIAAAIVAVSYWGLPAWVPVNRPTFAAAQADLQLDFPADQQERRQLPDGIEYFGASGTITNIGSTTRSVPPILIVLRDGHDRIVYSWEVYPPKRSLAPGESMTVNQAVTDVPRSAKVAEIGWKPS
ncbi:MAG: thioredoxin, partial [Porphyrobacter sp.]|nr:thioredoxin [Porphyrobacter sp.]